MITNSTILLSVDYLAPNSTSDVSGGLDLSDVLKCAIQGQAYFKENTSQGVRIHIYGSMGYGYDTEPYAAFDIPVHGNKTVSTSISLVPDPHYIQAQAINLDPNQTAESIEVRVAYTSP